MAWVLRIRASTGDTDVLSSMLWAFEPTGIAELPSDDRTELIVGYESEVNAAPAIEALANVTVEPGGIDCGNSIWGESQGDSPKLAGGYGEREYVVVDLLDRSHDHPAAVWPDRVRLVVSRWRHNIESRDGFGRPSPVVRRNQVQYRYRI